MLEMKKPDCYSKYKWFLQSSCDVCAVAKRCRELTLIRKDDSFRIVLK
jgi:hypothetical protein